MAYLSVPLIIIGIIFFLGAVVGLLRFPDFYCRMHAAGKGDTLSALLIILGIAVYMLDHFNWINLLLSVKIMLICAAIFLTGPTMTHALMDAGFESGLKHWEKAKVIDKREEAP